MIEQKKLEGLEGGRELKRREGGREGERESERGKGEVVKGYGYICMLLVKQIDICFL